MLQEIITRGGVSSVMGDRYIQSDEDTKPIYIDGKILYDWSMSKYLPTDFKRFQKTKLIVYYSR